MLKERKRRTPLYGIMLILSCIIALSGCHKTPAENNVTPDDYTVWGAPSTVKIRQEDNAYADKRPMRLDFAGVRGEYESAQLIISADKDIDFYNLTAADIVGQGGTVVAGTDVEIYNEWYIEIAVPTTVNTVAGMYPDALIPMDLAQEAGECTVKAGQNAGIWVTVHIPETAEPGVYTSTFTLTVDGNVHTVPVSLTVYAFTMPVETHTRTLFVNRPRAINDAELDSSVTMRETYYEYLLDYRVNSAWLPIETFSVEDFTAAAKKYAADERVNTYVMPYDNLGYTSLNVTAWKPMLLDLIKESTAELNLLDKLCFYFVDEPEATGQLTAAVNSYNGFENFKREIAEIVKSDTTGAYDNFKQAVGVDKYEEYLINLDSVCTFNPLTTTELLDKVSIWVPTVGHFQSQNQIDNMMALAAEHPQAELWWYGCSGPVNPWPTYHLDDNLVTLRTWFWLAQEYGVKGHLYWGTTSAGDPYVNPIQQSDFEGQAGSTVVGDGILLYPGLKYGVRHPLPSIRLMAVRDGLEEYELLYALQNGYATLAETYGADIDARETTAQLYAQTHTTTRIQTDLAVFDAARANVLSAIEESTQPHGFLLGDFSIFESAATVTMYADSENFRLYVGDTEVVPEGNRFVYTLDLRQSDTLNVTLVDKADSQRTYTISRFISDPTRVIADFDTDSVLEHITVSEGSDKAMSEDAGTVVSGKSAVFTLASRFTGNELVDRRFKPYVKMEAGMLADADFAAMKDLRFQVFNLGGQTVQFDVMLTYGTQQYLLGSVTVAAGQSTLVSLNVGSVSWSNKGNADGISLQFPNATDADGEPLVYNVAIDNLFGTYSGGNV